jgi:hypothetical protein
MHMQSRRPGRRLMLVFALVAGVMLLAGPTASIASAQKSHSVKHHLRRHWCRTHHRWERNWSHKPYKAAKHKPKKAKPKKPKPAPTTAPTPTVTPASVPTTTTSITDLNLSAGQHDVVYDGVDFKSSKAGQRATITITRAYNITIRNSVIEGSAWNAVSVNSTGSVHDITLQNVVIKSTPRMGFECTERGATGFYNIKLDRVTVEPSGSEAISFDGSGHDITVTNMLIEGAGTRPDLFSWGQGFEINGNSKVTVDGLTIYRTRGDSLNLNGPGGASGWSFRNVLVDAGVNNLGSVARGGSSNLLYAHNMNSSTWQGKFVNPGSSPMAYLDNCDNNSFSGLTLSGGSLSQVNGCSGNSL